MKGNKKIDINKNFYDNLYESGFLSSTIKLLFSFDQAYKAKYLKYYLKKQKKFRNGQSIFDFGMGTGALLSRMPFKFQYGYDLSHVAISNYEKISRLLGSSVKFTEHNFSASDKAFDVVIASHVLEHIPDYKSQLVKLYKCTDSEGLLAVVLPINEVIDDPKHCHSFNEEKILNEFSEYGICNIYKYDALTNLILDIEYNKNHRFMGKILRIFFGILPFWVVRKIDEYFLHRYPPSQILVLLEK